MNFRINSPNVICETFEEEVILLNFETGSYYSLDESGAEIWGLMEGGATTDGIIEEMSARYEGSREHIAKSVEDLILRLKENNLIVPNESGRAESTAATETRPPASQGSARPAFKDPVLREYTDMQDLLLLDPIHEVDEAGWPFTKKAPSAKEE